MTPSYAQYLDEVKHIRALDPDVRSARIRGPFPEDVELRPRARAVFKKLSVEEEAEARRAELSQAIARRDQELNEPPAPAPASVPAADAPHVREPHEIGGDTTSAATAATEEVSASQSATSSDEPSDTQQPAQHRNSFRRVKSLKVSVEVLRFLQNDFCSPRRTKSNNALLQTTAVAGDGTKSSLEGASSTRSTRTSMSKQPDAKSKSTSEPPSEPPKPKSKAVAALLEREQNRHPAATEGDNSTTSSQAPAPGVPNFLAELKKRTTAGAGDTPTEAVARSAPAVPNFLAELKKRAQPTEPTSPDHEPVAARDEPSRDIPVAKPAMSFLDELKRVRRCQDSATPDGNEPDATPPPSPPPVPVIPPMLSSTTAAAVPAPRSFLDELKARRQRTEEV
ncbi:hypothetical protein PINS_up014769 [Pythium insidiosum]|nr:hypothetical protein PINS_up014769 [Pythium insidiosum]